MLQHKTRTEFSMPPKPPKPPKSLKPLDPIKNADLIWPADSMPLSVRFDDIYFSRAGALAEKRHVFLHANTLPERWQQTASLGKEFFTLAELGFGGGLNFLLTCQAWIQHSPAKLRLHYLAFEKWPLNRGSLRRLLTHWPELAELAQQLLACYPEHTAGLHRLQLQPNIVLDLYLGDAMTGLQERHGHRENAVQCWYLDGFSPDKNPDLWSLPLLKQVARHSAPGASLSTYSVAGLVRRNVTAVGFQVHKVPGFGTKREMLVARFHAPSLDSDSATQVSHSRQPWLQLPLGQNNHNRYAVVIGGGLAGCATAYSLAQRGWRVTLLERDSLASGGSGNPQAVLQCRLAINDSALSQFYLLGYLYANRHFASLRHSRGLSWHDCGVLRLFPEQKFDQPRARKLEDFYDPRVLQPLTAAKLSRLANAELLDDGFHLPQSGWLNPQELCRLYCDDPLITVKPGTDVTAMQQIGETWHIMAGSELAAKSDIVILANAHCAAALEQADYCPVQPVRGQVTFCRATRKSNALQMVVAGDKYLCPAAHGIHTLGASYQPGDTSLDSRDSDTGENLKSVMTMFAPGSLGELTVVGQRTALRCGSLDQAPIVGALSDAVALREEFASLTRNAKARLVGNARHFPGLYINIAHGSHGLATCPLAGEIIAGLICNESLPVGRPVLDCLNPARFIIRNLKRQKSAT